MIVVTFILCVISFGCGRTNSEYERRDVRSIRSLRTWIPRHAFRSTVMNLHLVAMVFVFSGILVTPFFLQYWANEKGLDYVKDIQKQTGQDIGNSENRDVYLTCLFNGMQFSGRLLGPLISHL